MIGPRQGSWLGLGLLAGASLAIALLALRPPPARPANAPAQDFSALRAMADVRAIAQAPHPLGSAHQAQVRAGLLARMAALGLAPLPRSAADGAVNLLGLLPGRDRAAPAVLLMAHDDSVPAGPGAADDGAGVASALEIVRAIETSGPQARDLMVLFTDGEEAGLVGGADFFQHDPARGHAGPVVNLEARGDRGRAVMFETQPQAGAMIGALIGAHALSGASSLMPDLYRRLPNNTDLTWALRTGHPGMNFAFFAGMDAYHQPGDTAARLDPGALQSLGQQALAATRFFLAAQALPRPAPDRVYADLLGGPELSYPAAAGWAICAAALGLAGLAAGRAIRAGQTSLAGLGRGVLAAAGLIVLIGAGLWLFGEARLWLGGHRLQPLLAQDRLVLAAILLLGAGVALAWRALLPRLEPARLDLCVVLVLGAVAATLQAVAPLDAFIAAWPALLIAARLSAGRTLGAVLTLAAGAQTLYWLGLMFALAGQWAPVMLTPFLALPLLVLAPLAPRPGPRTLAAGSALAGIGLALGALAVLAR